MAICPNCLHTYKSNERHCSFCGKLLLTPPIDQGESKENLIPQQLKEKILDYDLVEKIEIGDFCPAYFVEKNGKRFLLKKMVLAFSSNEELNKIVINERNVFATLQHINLPESFSFILDENYLYSIFGIPYGRRLIDFVFPEKMADGTISTQKIVLPDLNRSIRWSRQIIDSTAYLHHQKPFPVIHRNLNPLSILIAHSSDQALIMDFGLLNSYRKAASIVSKDNSLISPGHFSPENVFDSGWADPRVDIYAFGRLLDFLLTGYIPEGSFSPPCFINRETNLDSRIHDRLSRIINRCLSTFQGDGYQTVDAIIPDLENALSSVALNSFNSIICVCGFPNLESARLCQKCGRLLHEKVSRRRSDDPTKLLQFDSTALEKLTKNLEQGKVAPLARFRLRENLDNVQSTPGFEELISLDELLLIEKMPHQKESALIALKFMRGRALLADEVGLGKTIEAGMILKELIRRSLASKILILCPTQLRGQWQAELFQKFNEVFLILGRDIDTPLSWFSDHLIAAYSAITDPFHKEILLSQNYGLVILDEAHNLNLPENDEVLQIIKNLQKKYFLLLSATPMHNSLEELYNIITLLRPGHFEDYSKFCDEFIDSETGRPRKESIERLRHSLHEVMIRHSREQVRKEYHFPERNPQTWPLEIDDQAQSFYERFREFYKQGVSDITNPKVLELLNSIVERLCSSKRAFGESISSLKYNKSIQRQFKGKNFLIELEGFRIQYPESLITPKLDKLVQLLLNQEMRRERVLVFSQYQETASFIYDYLRNNYPELRERCKLYNEKTPSAERDKVVEQFKEKSNTILMCPGEASEGLNLQLCSFMINFDLPWDPMKLEQRIGRIQRIGGKRKINIINLILNNTIETDILSILQEKIKIFEAVVGQVEAIIGNIQDEVDIPTIIGNIFMDRQMELVEKKLIVQDNPEVYDESAIEDTDSVEKQVHPMEYLDAKLQQPQESNMLNDVFFDLEAIDQI